MQDQKKDQEPIEPGRTPGMAEGEEEPGSDDTFNEPGRTPGSAEGEEDVADKNLGGSK